MAGKVSSEMRRGIVEKYSAGNISKAQLARENGISISTVNRILKEAVMEVSGNRKEEAIESAPAAEKRDIYKEYSEYFARYGISREDLISIVSELKEVEARFLSASGNVPHGEASADISDYLFRDFLAWAENRKKHDMEAAALSSEITMLEDQKSRMKEEIDSLSSKVVNLEMTVGQMRQEAQKVIDSISMAQERISAMELRLSEDRELLVVSAGLNWILKKGEITDETMDFIGRYHNLWKPTDGEIRIKIRNALIQELENSLSKLKGIISA
ncbi:MAG: hypothetical protein QXN26_00245 [Thermoplasmataceae archaeon]